MDESSCNASELSSLQQQLSALSTRLEDEQSQKTILKRSLDEKESLLEKMIEELQVERMATEAAAADHAQNDLTLHEKIHEKEIKLQQTEEKLRIALQQQRSQQEDLQQLFIQLTQQQDAIDKLEEELSSARIDTASSLVKIKRLEVNSSSSSSCINIAHDVCTYHSTWKAY